MIAQQRLHNALRLDSLAICSVYRRVRLPVAKRTERSTSRDTTELDLSGNRAGSELLGHRVELCLTESDWPFMWFTRTTGNGCRFYIFVSQDSRKSKKYEDRGPSDWRVSAARREVTEDIEMARIMSGIGTSNVPTVTITNPGMVRHAKRNTQSIPEDAPGI
ncbi:hypothetical protein [Paraburkholderia terrae]|uniref:hypothetical protein n=1 Tax=Paraburkholderia terrae TaxID=311230 RepID=UPI001E302C2A|nr:hypothetical protein [Paraburkholderia terrae]